MTDLSAYLALAQGAREESVLVALLPEGCAAFEPDEVPRRIARMGVEVLGVEAARPCSDGWEVGVEARVPGLSRPFGLRITLAPNHLERAHLEWSRLTPAQIELARRARWSVAVAAALGRAPLFDYHAQVRILMALAPDAVVIVDANACTMRPAEWALEVACSQVPPSPNALFSIHLVSDGPGKPAWLHTHGLLRCGSVELEMLDITREGSGLLGELLNATAGLFIERGIPAPDEPFIAGKDMPLLWLPWERGLSKLPRDVLGGERERDGSHRQPSGLLFAPERSLLGQRRYRSVSRYLPLLNDNPLLFVSDMETVRRAMLARERLEQFVQLQRQHGADEAWTFYMKLGYPREDDSTGRDREHLWFLVHAMEGDRVDATLDNQPYHVPGLNKGQRGTYALDKMTDWEILSPYGRFGPDSVFELIRAPVRLDRSSLN